VESNKSIITGKILTNREVAKDHFVMSLAVPDDFQEVLPGQFIMIRVKGREFPFLARPFSVYSIYSLQKMIIIEILYQVVGKGTIILSRLRKDDELSILGPLGRGFDIVPDRKKIALVAGGIGVAPLSFLAEYLGRQASGSQEDWEIVSYMGAKNSELLIDRRRLENVCSRVMISTDDGSDGYHGTVTDLFKEDIRSYKYDDLMVYSCGPYPMMKRMAEILKEHSIPCQVSVEERMACGVGACLGCTVRTDTQKEDHLYMRVCKDGPVFDIDTIIWR